MAVSPIYVAGFLDADGWISIQPPSKTGGAETRIGITNTNLQVLILIQEQYGGRLNSKTRYRSNHKQGWDLHFRVEEQKKLLEDILPYLIIKKEKAYLLKLYFEGKKDRLELIEKMVRLNKRGLL